MVFKSFHICSKCSICPESDSSARLSSYTIFDADNEEVFDMECLNGHKTKGYILAPKYSLFIDNALNAFSNGHYLESFMSFYSALENYRLEFSKAYAYLYCHVPFEDVENSFKLISRQSERIYGAYFQAYLGFFKRVVDDPRNNQYFPILSNKTVKLRNEIVHRSYYPTKQEVEENGYLIYQHIKYHSMKFISKYEDGSKMSALLTWRNECFQYWCAKNPNIEKKDIEIINDTSSLKLSTSSEYDRIKTFEELLKDYEKKHYILQSIKLAKQQIYNNNPS